ncbi:MAG TPA: hypothetical protein VHG30_10190 [Microvirga sp.]|jgi:hypothetical protein|nr:hypothetical protein [Microvirga sp.]
MTSLPLVRTLRVPVSSRAGAEPGRAPRRGILLRIVDAIAESNRRKAEREIALFLARRGGQLTDDLERRIARSLPGSPL